MRAYPALAFVLLLAGCGNVTGADILRMAIWPIPVPDNIFGEADSEPVADWHGAGESADGPTALSLTLGSRRGTATLIQEEGERRLWRTRGGVVVATDGPRVVATAGLRRILAATRFDGVDPLTRLSELGEGEMRGARVVDVMRSGRDPASMRFGLRLDCVLRPGAPPAEDTVLIEERCGGAARFTNRFWADARSLAVFRSEQWVGEDMPPLVIEVVSTRPEPVQMVSLPR